MFSFCGGAGAGAVLSKAAAKGWEPSPILRIAFISGEQGALSPAILDVHSVSLTTQQLHTYVLLMCKVTQPQLLFSFFFS